MYVYKCSRTHTHIYIYSVRTFHHAARGGSQVSCYKPYIFLFFFFFATIAIYSPKLWAASSPCATENQARFQMDF